MRAPMKRQGWAVIFLAIFLLAAGCGTVGWTAGSNYEVWVTNQGINKVQILDGKTLEVIAEVAAGTKPHNVTFSRDFKRAYVANVGSNDFTVIDADARQPIRTVPAGKTAHHVAVSPNDRLLLVSNPGEHTVMLYDARSLERLRVISVGKGPAMAVFTRDGKRAYVSNGGDAVVSVIDVAEGKVVKTIAGAGRGAMGMAFAADDRRLFVTGGGDNKTSVIDTATDTVTAEVVTGKEPHGAALAEGGRLILIPDRLSDAISLVDPGTLKTVATIGNVERPDMIEAFGSKAYATMRGHAVTGDPKIHSGKEAGLAVVDLESRRLERIVKLGGDPHGVAVRPVGGGARARGTGY